MAYFRQIPGGAFLVETGLAERQIPGSVFAIEGIQPVVVPPVTPPPVTTTDAGGKKRRTIYRIRVDGQVFEFLDLSAAIQFLNKATAAAKQLAAKKAQEEVERQIEANKGTDKPIVIPEFEAPKIEINSRDLRAAQSEARREIQRVYEQARIDAELMLLFAEAKRKEQNDAATLLLLH